MIIFCFVSLKTLVYLLLTMILNIVALMVTTLQPDISKLQPGDRVVNVAVLL